MKIFEFVSAQQRFAVPLSAVECVVHSALPAPIPDSPAHVLGLLNVAQKPAIVVDLACRLGLRAPSLTPEQSLVLLARDGFLLGLCVDTLGEVGEWDAAAAGPAAPVPAPMLAGTQTRADGLVLILDPEQVLHEAQERALLAALEGKADA